MLQNAKPAASGFTPAQKKALHAVHRQFMRGDSGWQQHFNRFLCLHPTVAESFQEEEGKLVVRSTLFAAFMTFSPFFQLVIASHYSLSHTCSTIWRLHSELLAAGKKDAKSPPMSSSAWCSSTAHSEKERVSEKARIVARSKGTRSSTTPSIESEGPFEMLFVDEPVVESKPIQIIYVDSD